MYVNLYIHNLKNNDKKREIRMKIISRFLLRIYYIYVTFCRQMLKNEKNYFIIKMILQIKYKRVKKMKKTLCIILIIILLPIFFVNMVILIDAWTHPDEVPSFFGWKPFIVLAESMEHTIDSGDVVIVKEIDSKELKKGDIIAYKQENIVFVSRISQVINENESTKYITKGDNMADVDPGYVLESQFEGILKYRIEKIGNAGITPATNCITTLYYNLTYFRRFCIPKSYERSEYL